MIAYQKIKSIADTMIFDFFASRDFQISFWSSIISSIVVSAIIGLVVYHFTTLFKTPKLTFVVKQGQFYSNKVVLLESANGDYEASFRLSVKNYGSEAFKSGEGYWHVYFPNASGVTNTGGTEVFQDSGQRTHFRDLINLPIYPDSFTDLGPEYKIYIKRENISKSGIRFFFQTNYGYFPKSVKIDSDTGAVKYEDMGYIEVSV